MSVVTPSIVVANLLAAAELLSLTPWRSVQDALDRLGASSAGVAPDLLSLCGSEACLAIEAEIVALTLPRAA